MFVFCIHFTGDESTQRIITIATIYWPPTLRGIFQTLSELICTTAPWDRKWRSRKLKGLVYDRIGRKQQNEDWNHGCLASMSMILTSTLYQPVGLLSLFASLKDVACYVKALLVRARISRSINYFAYRQILCFQHMDVDNNIRLSAYQIWVLHLYTWHPVKHPA